MNYTLVPNGNSIANVTGDAAWAALSTGAWCDYSNLTTNSTKYGHLYNWYAVNDNRQIAPEGWHIATNAEWKILITFVTSNLDGSLNEAKAISSSAYWATSNTVGGVGNNPALNNYTGFSALPGGCRTDVGLFKQSQQGYWWCINTDGTYAYYVQIDNSGSGVGIGNNYSKYGYSVRCIKD